LNQAGKLKRVKYKYGRTPAIKKAIITLKKDEKISIFEGV
jgi:ribosomal protein L23